MRAASAYVSHAPVVWWFRYRRYPGRDMKFVSGLNGVRLATFGYCCAEATPTNAAENTITPRTMTASFCMMFIGSLLPFRFLTQSRPERNVIRQGSAVCPKFLTIGCRDGLRRRSCAL